LTGPTDDFFVCRLIHHTYTNKMKTTAVKALEKGYESPWMQVLETESNAMLCTSPNSVESVKEGDTSNWFIQNN